ncbi:MAG: hypothetical protein EOP83_05735 [Verrucomicrobiaceae bacterium]|nr:MAG: hypothetical protein EOP83_05735 [Verrucomicrobiaceae bacterium]
MRHGTHIGVGLYFQHTLYIGDAGPKGRSLHDPNGRPKGVPFQEIDDWCADQFGPSAVTGRYQTREVHPARKWYRSGYKMYFQNPEDAFAFKMRWL